MFKGIGNWFGNKFKEAKNKIFSVFGNIGSWFSGKAKAVVNAFVNIPKNLKDRFFEAVEKIKEVFLPLVNWFSDRIDEILGFFSGIGEKIGGFFGGIADGVTGFFGGGGKNQIAGHADGGIFTKHHIAEVSEGNQPEAIVPLTKPARAKNIMSKAMDYLGVSAKSTDYTAITQRLDAVIQIMKQSASMFATLNEGFQKNVGVYNAGATNNVYNYKIEMPSNYTIHDASGRPEATAQAVDRMSELRLRNLQGVLN